MTSQEKSKFMAEDRKASRRMSNDERGNVAILFALCLLPTIGIVGYSADFASGLMAKRRLDAAADATILNAVSKSSNSTLQQPSQDQVRNTFNAVLGHTSNITVTDLQLTSAYTDQNLQVKLSYKATLPSFFGSLFKVPFINLANTAVSVAPLPLYSNFYLLLDNSPSMGLGATPTDISNLQAATPNRCAFACHQHTFQSGTITGDDANDYYHIAKNKGITTRIDVLRSASQHLFDTAISNEKTSGRYSAAIYTFSDVMQIVSPLSSDLKDVQSKASTVDLAYAYFDQRNTQTSYDTALSYIKDIVTTGGDGSSSSSPSKYIFLVTDGVQDEPVAGRSGSRNQPDHWASPNQAVTSPPSDAKMNISNMLMGNVSSGRLISKLSSNLCDTIKNNNIKIAILYTPYQPVTTNGDYNNYVAPIINDVPPALKACASDNLFFTVTPTQGIDDAMKKMFTAATTGQPRLTQ